MQIVQGAVPGVAPLAAVPPEMLLVCPGPLTAGCTQAAVNRITLALKLYANTWIYELPYAPPMYCRNISWLLPVNCAAPMLVAKVVGVPDPTTLLVPLYPTPAMVFSVLVPVNESVPQAVAKPFQSGSMSVPVLVLLNCKRIIPPAPKK